MSLRRDNGDLLVEHAPRKSYSLFLFFFYNRGGVGGRVWNSQNCRLMSFEMYVFVSAEGRIPILTFMLS